METPSVREWTKCDPRNLDKPVKDTSCISEKYYTKDKLYTELQDPATYKPAEGYEVIETEWEQPESLDWTKCDSDASVIPEKIGFTYSCVFRNQGGRKIVRIVKGRGKRVKVTILHAEVFGVHRAVVNAVQLKMEGKIQKLHLSCDNMHVVNLVKNEKAVLPEDGEHVYLLIPEIRRLLIDHFGIMNEGWKMTHNNREGMFLADYLSFLGRGLGFDCEEYADRWMDFTIRYFCHRDVNGPAYIKETKIPLESLPEAERREKKLKKLMKRADMSPNTLAAKFEKQRKKQSDKRKRQRARKQASKDTPSENLLADKSIEQGASPETLEEKEVKSKTHRPNRRQRERKRKE